MFTLSMKNLNFPGSKTSGLLFSKHNKKKLFITVKHGNWTEFGIFFNHKI